MHCMCLDTCFCSYSSVCVCVCVSTEITVLFSEALECFIPRQLQSRLSFSRHFIALGPKDNEEEQPDMQPHLIREVVRGSTDDFSKLA